LDNGEETEVYWGVLLFPKGNGRARTKTLDNRKEIPENLEATTSHSNTAEATLSPIVNNEGNSSSLDSSIDGDSDFFGIHDSSTEADSTNSSNEDVNIEEAVPTDIATDDDHLLPSSKSFYDGPSINKQALLKLCSFKPFICKTRTYR